MPIKPENKGRYPQNWKEIRQRVLKRAKNRCEGCGDRNYMYKISDCDRSKVIRVILTVAHLNHTPEDCRMNNLKAWCQKCHNRHDIEHRKQTRKGGELYVEEVKPNV